MATRIFIRYEKCKCGKLCAIGPDGLLTTCFACHVNRFKKRKEATGKKKGNYIKFINANVSESYVSLVKILQAAKKENLRSESVKNLLEKMVERGQLSRHKNSFKIKNI